MEKTNWYTDAVVYQIYPFSFMDGNNDGMGDLPGIISKLDYIKDLGATAIWFSPLYLSPCKDYGYDVADYKSIDPKFGTMEDFERLMEECRKRDLRVIMDMVLNHTSDQHRWFKEALADINSPYTQGKETASADQLDELIHRFSMAAYRGYGQILSSSLRA